ncbi:Hypothetical_protein [Hexamita inflata]|uniref:Hypothetical_protein n=1 Tax=Hexamita inflata TaxID=28002 RepID=A0AA86PTJ7_9EUKA|nr:Hypothetical protein HINF_LOCUS31557 [Hexamita inflata]
MLNQKFTQYQNNTQSPNKSKSNHVEQKLREYKRNQSVNTQNQSQTPNKQKLNALISKMHSENESKANKLSKLKQMKQQIASGPKLSTIDLVNKYHPGHNVSFLRSPCRTGNAPLPPPLKQSAPNPRYPSQIIFNPQIQ